LLPVVIIPTDGAEMKKPSLYKLYTTKPGSPNNPDGIREYFQRVIENMPNNVYWLNRECVTMGCNINTLKLLGLKTQDEFVGITYEEMGELANWDKEIAESFKKDDMEVMDSGVAKYNVEEPVMYNDDGNEIYYMSSRVPIFDEKEKVIGVVGISVDITGKKKLENQLKKTVEKLKVANEAKSEFIANMSHDLRTPMTGLLGMLDGLLFTSGDISRALESTQDPTKDKLNLLLKDFVKKVEYSASLAKESATSLNQLHNDILDNVELESGESNETVKPFNLDNLIQSVISLQKPVSEDKKLELTAEIDESTPCYLKGLSQSFKRVLLNLIGNALKFTKHGSVSVHVEVDNKEMPIRVGNEVTLKIQVRDTGIGIPNEKFDEIFGQFSRLSSSYEGIHKGLGLGLYVVKKYTNLMKGSISIESKVGEGACFTVYLPFLVEKEGMTKLHESVDTEQEIPNEKSPLRDESNITEGLRVLLVEDDKIAAIATRMNLSNIGCQVDWADSGESALEKLVSTDYSIIFMDIGLPNKSGIDVAKEIRSLSEINKSKTPIIALTGHARGKSRKLCLDSVMQDVLSKPASIGDLKKSLDYFSSP